MILSLFKRADISQYDKDKVLKFIVNMKKTGQPVSKALIYYANVMADKAEVKKTVSFVVDLINKGKDVEDALYASKIIDDFQYSILKSSKNKNEAYENVLTYKRDLKQADKVYVNNYSKAMLSLIAMSIGMPFLIEMLQRMIDNVKSFKADFVLSTGVAFIVDLKDIFPLVAFMFVCAYIGGLTLYFYSYNQNLPLHYRLFKLKAMNDSTAYFTMINDMLVGGLNTYEIFDLLGKYMHPKSSRNFFFKIRDSLKNNKSITKELKDLGTNDMAIFNIQMAKETNDTKGGFKNALISIKDYVEKERKEYVEIIELVTFACMVVPFSGILFFITIATIDISMLD